MNQIQTWQVRDGSLVVSSTSANFSVCMAISQSYAEWIAQRLNLAAKLEQMTYDYATGKTDGNEIVEMVHEATGL